MARPKSPDGKSTLLALKISERQREAYDAARGDVPLADWVRSALDRVAALEGRWADPGTAVPPAVFDRLAASLDEPGEPVPALERAAARLRARRESAAAKGKFPCCSHCPHAPKPEGHDQKCRRCP